MDKIKSFLARKEVQERTGWSLNFIGKRLPRTKLGGKVLIQAAVVDRVLKAEPPMRKARTTTRQRLDLARLALAEEDASYIDALNAHNGSMRALAHLVKVGGRPPGGMRCASGMLTAMWSLYAAEHAAKRVVVQLGHPSTGVNVHFLEWADSRLPGGPRSGNLLRVIRRVLAHWRKANPGVVLEAAGAGYCTV